MNMKQDAPDPSEFDHGDLILPKTPNQFVPYTSEPSGDYLSDKHKWEHEKATYISCNFSKVRAIIEPVQGWDQHFRDA